MIYQLPKLRKKFLLKDQMICFKRWIGKMRKLLL
jgi:hypothetical protein